jgi:hypothetical protein
MGKYVECAETLLIMVRAECYLSADSCISYHAQHHNAMDELLCCLIIVLCQAGGTLWFVVKHLRI